MAAPSAIARTPSSTSWSISATANSDGPEAGFQECSNIGMEVTVSEYRNGNEKENSRPQDHGLNKSTDVTLKRGVIGSFNLYPWLNEIRNGDPDALRTVTIQLHQRGPHRRGPDLEAPARADHQARQPARSTPRAPTSRWRS